MKKNKDHSRLFVPSKKAYINGERPKVKCILCSVVEKDEKVASLEIYRGKYFIVSANLYPYNSGHIMIFPQRHIETIEDFTNEEVIESFELQKVGLKVLRDNYNPSGFNVGYNMGESSGGSIDHLHLHIVPRYHREVGFIDVIGGSRIIVEDPNETLEKLKKAFDIHFLPS